MCSHTAACGVCVCRGCHVHLKILILHVKVHKVFLPLQLPVRSLIMKELGNEWNQMNKIKCKKSDSCPVQDDATGKTGLSVWGFVVPCVLDTGANSQFY